MHKRSQVSLAALLALGLVGFAHAQDTQLERVEVTGSRIRQVDAETAQPVQKITSAEIQKSGLVTVGDILNQLSAAGTPDFSKGSALASNAEEGGQYINLRNLGSQRLLVLVDSKRWTQSIAGYTDLSTVPSALIDHIDVLKDGASSIYGSDAIAGVVNIILKKSMDGGSVSVYYGANQKGDGQTTDASVTFGASNEHSSLMFGANFSQQKPVWARTRDITSQSYGTGPDQYGAGFGAGPWGRINPVNPVTGVVEPAKLANGSPNPAYFNRVLNHTGTATSVGTGSASNDPANYHNGVDPLADTYNSSQDMMFQIGTEMKSIFTKGTIDITPSTRFSATAMFADRTSTAQVAGYPLNSTSQSGYPVYISKDSYYNPYGNQAVGNTTGTGGVDLFFTRRTIEVPRVTVNNNRASHFDMGLDGDLTLGGKAWNWDAGVNFSKAAGNEVMTGNLNLPNLKKALGPSFNNNGVIQCGTAANPIGLSSCVPFDILGGPSASTAAALAYVMSTSQLSYGSTVKSIYGNLSGEIYRLPAGPLALAVGVERRDVSGYNVPDQIDQDALTTNLAGNSTYGKYNVKEAYAELNVPILKGVPGAELLSVDLASRYSDYSSFGNTTNSKASIMYKPVKDLLTRATWAQGFRAPTLGDTFGGGSQTFDTFLDPCDTVYGAAKTDAAVQARCVASGTNATYRQVNQAGQPIPSAGGTQSITAFNAGAGNAFLTPETAKTLTAGFVYNPSYLPGLNIGLDWYRIDIKNVITAVSATYVANQCFVQNISSFCSSIKRDPATGQIINLSRGNANLGELLAEGYDLEVDYKFRPTSFGQFALRSATSFVTKNSSRSDMTAPLENEAGGFPFYKVKSNITLDWSYQAWSATWTTHYYSGFKAQCWDNDDTSTCSNGQATWNSPVNGDGVTGYNKFGSVSYSDLSVGYKLPWKGSIMVGANNVFGKKPRINYDATLNSSSSSVDPDLPIDRFYWVRYSQSF
ncbi:TonB-dependent receptor [Paucibacter sp. R3-3]|uniref:TonB-dependent receptor n=1 Tax=Roseateles agri TaxID=3098619 RepID=A0ABU5DRB8_9BURK|nr:TonB-dependent receptor [Paucibacter sp. R3-3]MDY0748867.1 TonB-dependent receptor [Paucibacter sp. R3-3]